MVSKVAVIALVAIIAVPILLGYGMNLQEVTETDYKVSGDSVNVTPLLQNSVDYTDVAANTYQINSNFQTGHVSNSSIPTVPIYNTINSIKSSYPMATTIEYNWSWPHFNTFGSNLSLYYFILDFNYPTESFWVDLKIRVGGVDSVLLTVNNLHEYYYVAATHTFYYAYYNGSVLNYGQISNDNILGVQYNQSANWTGGTLRWGSITTSTNTFADISAGYYFNDGLIEPTIQLPDKTKSFIMTINLDSITDANYTRTIDIYPDAGAYVARVQLIKTTVGSDVTWQMATGFSLNTITDLYYDPARNDNTYQLYVDMSEKEKISATSEKVTVNCSMKYVGGWSPAIGSANAYLNYDFTYGAGAPIANNFYNGLAKISFEKANTRTPTVRMDGAVISGYEMAVIVDQEYTPASFKDNPSTVIESVTKYGSSFSFGGNTYTVSNGNITMGSHDIPVKGLVLSSVPNDNGGYDNKIGNTLVSSTAQPSTITFNGHWSASIATTAQESFTYTKTEWTAGEFAWNGIDQNFLMIGLLTSLGAFIALGIYIRRTKANLWPLLLVCGGAAMLFFCML